MEKVRKNPLVLSCQEAKPLILDTIKFLYGLGDFQSEVGFCSSPLITSKFTTYYFRSKLPDLHCLESLMRLFLPLADGVKEHPNQELKRMIPEQTDG